MPPLSEKSEVQGLRLRIALVVLAALALGYGGFELGRSSAGYFVVNSMMERLGLQIERGGAPFAGGS